jgi:hypothetical protein
MLFLEATLGYFITMLYQGFFHLILFFDIFSFFCCTAATNVASALCSMQNTGMEGHSQDIMVQTSQT